MEGHHRSPWTSPWRIDQGSAGNGNHFFLGIKLDTNVMAILKGLPDKYIMQRVLVFFVSHFFKKGEGLR